MRDKNRKLPFCSLEAFASVVIAYEVFLVLLIILGRRGRYRISCVTCQNKLFIFATSSIAVSDVSISRHAVVPTGPVVFSLAAWPK